MENNTRLREYYEKSGTLMKLSIVGGILSLIGLVVVIWLGISVRTKYGAWAGSDVFALMVVPFAMAALYAIAAAVYGSMARSAYQEEEDKATLEKRKKESISAFDVNEDVRFTAGRSFKNFKKFAPHVIAALGLILIAALVFSFWQMWGARQAGVTPMPVDALNTVAISLFIGLCALIIGAFSIGQSKDMAYRWLRPVGAWLIAAFVVGVLAAIGGLYYYYKMPHVNALLARIVFVSYIVLGCELVFSFISEFYRPRSLEVPRPVFESRILALFTEPGGVARNVANMLDYQFGFKVSGTWIYAFLERALFPLLIVWLIIIFAFTCIAEVGPNQVGVRMNVGKIVDKDKVLEPGFYLKLPYPFGKIVTYSCTEIKQIYLGAKMVDQEGKESRPETVVWGKQHYAEEVNYLVASPTDNPSYVPVSLIGTSIPLQYRIKKDKLFDYAFRNEDSDAMLKNIGEQVASKYFASVSIFDIMSSGRAKAAQDLHELIQKEADRLNIGIEVVRINIHDAHPPEKVAEEFQKVVSAMEEMETAKYVAEAYANRVLPLTEASAFRMKVDANAYAYTVKAVSRAESERFKRQLDAYRVLPQYFKLRTYLDMMEQNMTGIRKFILSSALEYEVYEFNFEKKSQLDLIDVDPDQLLRN